MNLNYMRTHKMNSNTKMFIKTINSLALSQGFYSRLSQQIHEAISNDASIIDKLNENLPKFNDTLDVVLYLEQ